MAHSVMPILNYISQIRKANDIRKLKTKIRVEMRHTAA